jgi:hypothetical protein
MGLKDVPLLNRYFVKKNHVWKRGRSGMFGHHQGILYKHNKI